VSGEERTVNVIEQWLSELFAPEGAKLANAVETAYEQNKAALVQQLTAAGASGALVLAGEAKSVVDPIIAKAAGPFAAVFESFVGAEIDQLAQEGASALASSGTDAALEAGADKIVGLIVSSLKAL
jgi:hypothetical protein